MTWIRNISPAIFVNHNSLTLYTIQYLLIIYFGACDPSTTLEENSLNQIVEAEWRIYT